jgi:hypothetical protein
MMESEALRDVRTMRQVKTSLDVARRKKVRTTNSLSKTKEEVARLESLADPRAEQVLSKETRRLAAFDASVHKSRERLVRSREKLAVTINKNRALTDLRRTLQQARWEGKDPALPKAEEPHPEQNLRQMEIRY